MSTSTNTRTSPGTATREVTGAPGPRLHVDWVACDGHGVCSELLPERITADEWGYPIVDGAPLDSELLDLAKRAVSACPMLALRLMPAS